MTLEELQAALDVAKKEAEEAKAAAASLRTDADTHKAEADKYRGVAAKAHLARLLGDLHDPTDAQYAPPPRLTESGDLDKKYVEELTNWKAQKKHWFKSADVSTQKVEDKPEDKKLNTPATGNTDGRTIEYYRELRRTNKNEWAKPEVQKAYIALVNKAENRS
jgi:hypothetical protein